MPEIVYTDLNRDCPKGHYKGAIRVTKMCNAVRMMFAHPERREAGT
jgi:hypothetical protein